MNKELALGIGCGIVGPSRQLPMASIETIPSTGLPQGDDAIASIWYNSCKWISPGSQKTTVRSLISFVPGTTTDQATADKTLVSHVGHQDDKLRQRLPLRRLAAASRGVGHAEIAHEQTQRAAFCFISICTYQIKDSLNEKLASLSAAGPFYCLRTPTCAQHPR